MTNRIQKAIDIFLDAINEGTLAKGTCIACAVANLVAHGLNGEIYKKDNQFECTVDNFFWGEAFSTSNNFQKFDADKAKTEAVFQNIVATDFSLEELMAIEYAFETNTTINYINYKGFSKEAIRADQIKGLEAVVKVMLEFDEQSDNIQEVFTKKAELIPV